MTPRVTQLGPLLTYGNVSLGTNRSVQVTLALALSLSLSLSLTLTLTLTLALSGIRTRSASLRKASAAG